MKCTCPMYIYTNVFVTYIYAEGSFFLVTKCGFFITVVCMIFSHCIIYSIEIFEGSPLESGNYIIQTFVI